MNYTSRLHATTSSLNLMLRLHVLPVEAQQHRVTHSSCLWQQLHREERSQLPPQPFLSNKKAKLLSGTLKSGPRTVFKSESSVRPEETKQCWCSYSCNWKLHPGPSVLQSDLNSRCNTRSHNQFPFKTNFKKKSKSKSQIKSRITPWYLLKADSSLCCWPVTMETLFLS